MLLLFSVYLTVRRLLEERHIRNEVAYLKRTQQVWMDYLYSDKEWNDTLIPKDRYEMKGAERLLIKLLNSTYVDGTREKIYLFANNYMTAYYQKLLRSPEWSHRMNGLYRTLDFHLIPLAEKHLAKWNNRTPASIEEEYYLALLKIMTGETTAMDLIKEGDHEFSEHQNRSLLLKVDARQLKELVEHYPFLSHPAKIALMDVVGEKNYIEYQSFLIDQLSKEEALELRIRLLKALDMMGYLRGYKEILPFLDSPHWEERMLATRLVGMFPIEESHSYVLPRLEDASWWVRSTAARAVAKQKHGIELLRMYQQQTTDRFAKEIIDEQLVRGGWA